MFIFSMIGKYVGYQSSLKIIFNKAQSTELSQILWEQVRTESLEVLRKFPRPYDNKSCATLGYGQTKIGLETSINLDRREKNFGPLRLISARYPREARGHGDKFIGHETKFSAPPTRGPTTDFCITTL